MELDLLRSATQPLGQTIDARPADKEQFALLRAFHVLM